MRIVFALALCFGLALVGCRKRKAVSPPEPPPPAPEASAQPTLPTQPAVAANPAGTPQSAADVEASIEFSDLNDVIASFEAFHKRMPTVEDLKKAYYGGTKPLPIPPGYKLVIDPKTKKAKLVR